MNGTEVELRERWAYFYTLSPEMQDAINRTRFLTVQETEGLLNRAKFEHWFEPDTAAREALHDAIWWDLCMGFTTRATAERNKVSQSMVQRVKNKRSSQELAS